MFPNGRRLPLSALFALPVLLLLVAGGAGLSWRWWRALPQSSTQQKTFDAILVLGTPSLPDGSPSPEQRERVLEGVREWRRGVAPRIIMSGTAAHNQWVEAKSMADFARAQGVPAGDVIEETQAQNTIQNVYYTVAILRAHGWHSLDVVSSWSHVPRASLILAHFPVAWRVHAAPWPPEFGILDRSARDWSEAEYCVKLHLLGFPRSRFLPTD